jgi:hypothetical protein
MSASFKDLGAPAGPPLATIIVRVWEAVWSGRVVASRALLLQAPAAIAASATEVRAFPIRTEPFMTDSFRSIAPQARPICFERERASILEARVGPP